MNNLFRLFKNLITDLKEELTIINPPKFTDNKFNIRYRATFPDPLDDEEIRCIQTLKTGRMDAYESFYKEHRNSIYTYYFIELCQEDKDRKNKKDYKSLAQELATRYFRDFFLNKKYHYCPTNYSL